MSDHKALEQLIIKNGNLIIPLLNMSILADYHSQLPRYEEPYITEGRYNGAFTSGEDNTINDYQGVLNHSKKFIRFIKDDIVYGDEEDESDGEEKEESKQQKQVFYGIVDKRFLEDLQQNTDVQTINFCFLSQDEQVAERFCLEHKDEEEKKLAVNYNIEGDLHDNHGSIDCLLKVTIPPG